LTHQAIPNEKYQVPIFTDNGGGAKPAKAPAPCIAAHSAWHPIIVQSSARNLLASDIYNYQHNLLSFSQTADPYFNIP